MRRTCLPLGARRFLTLQSLESRLPLAAEPIISEFLAANQGSIVDEDGDTSDWIEIRMYQPDATNTYIASDVICNVDDTGSFTFQNIHQQWTPGSPVYIQFSRAYESNVTMPYNDGISRVVGMYTILGAGFMN